MRALAEATIAALPNRSAAAVGRLMGIAYALTHEDLRAQVKEVTAQSYAFGEQWLREMIKEQHLPMPADQLMRIVHVLIKPSVAVKPLEREME